KDKETSKSTKGQRRSSSRGIQELGVHDRFIYAKVIKLHSLELLTKAGYSGSMCPAFGAVPKW
ncbi:MAG TPA: hypothetical protein PK775_08870, partial [Rectinema sp.]|nr:hypothetical protein [Rectinema sp.]